jgi:hypothetical protein
MMVLGRRPEIKGKPIRISELSGSGRLPGKGTVYNNDNWIG